MSTLDPQIRLCPSKSTASTIQGSYPPAFKICCPPVGDREPRKSRFTERKDDTRNAPIPIDHRVARIVTERPNRNLFRNHTDLTAQDIGAIGDNHEIPRFCLGIGRIIDRPERRGPTGPVRPIVPARRHIVGCGNEPRTEDRA